MVVVDHKHVTMIGDWVDTRRYRDGGQRNRVVVVGSVIYRKRILAQLLTGNEEELCILFLFVWTTWHRV